MLKNIQLTKNQKLKTKNQKLRTKNPTNSKHSNQTKSW
jgi:hypothetical protein